MPDRCTRTHMKEVGGCRQEKSGLASKLTVFYITLVVIEVPILGIFILARRPLVDGRVIGVGDDPRLALLTPLFDPPA